MSEGLLDWVVRNGHPLTDVQLAMTEWHSKNGSLVGLARPIGRSVLFPLVRRGKSAPSVIDAAGYEQLAAVLSCRCP